MAEPMWPNQLLTPLLLVVAALAGCVGSEAAPRDAGEPADTAPAPPPKFTDETGAITGVVTDEEGLGLEAVEVGLIEL